MVSGQAGLVKGRFDVRFGSKADMCGAIGHVRFTPESDRKSGHQQPVMSACLESFGSCLSAPLVGEVTFGPIAHSRRKRNRIPLWTISTVAADCRKPDHLCCGRSANRFPTVTDRKREPD